MLNICRQICTSSICKMNRTTVINLQKQYNKLYEPDYLKSMESKIPLYKPLNIQLKGYDYPVLESYQKFVHNLLKNININVEECWATPVHEMQVTKYKPKSSIVESQYHLKVYERNLQVTEVNSIQYPLILRILEASLPEGVTLNVHQHEDWHEELRYVPDKELLQLKTQLDDMSTSNKKK